MEEETRRRRRRRSLDLCAELLHVFVPFPETGFLQHVVVVVILAVVVVVVVTV